MKRKNGQEHHKEQKDEQALSQTESQQAVAEDVNAVPDHEDSSEGQTEKPVACAETEKSAEQTQIDTFQTALEKKEKEIAALSDKYLRLMAEYDNYRKRSQKEKDAIYGDSVVQVVREWLPVIDDLERAEFAADQYQSEEARKIVEGISMIRKQVLEVLEKLGVSSIDCCGKPFDPNLHDAVMHVDDETAGASTVVEVLRKGYIKDERVIRHSVVKVAN